MQDLIDDIVQELTKKDCDLPSALLKTKVLAHKLKLQPLKTWVNYELDGYPNHDALPKYRKYNGEVVGQMSNGAWMHNNKSIPLFHLKDEIQKSMEEMDFYNGIASLLETAQSANGQALSRRIPSEGLMVINHELPVNGMYQVVSASTQISSSVIQDILNNVKSRLLEFLLELEDQFEINPKPADIVEKKDEVNRIFIDKIGDGATFSFGDKNTQNVSNTIVTGDFSLLEKALKGNGVEDSDISELSKIINNDPVDTKKKEYKKPLNNWMKKMIDKSVDGSWDVGVAASGQIIGTALQKFFGF